MCSRRRLFKRASLKQEAGNHAHKAILRSARQRTFKDLFLGGGAQGEDLVRHFFHVFNKVQGGQQASQFVNLNRS